MADKSSGSNRERGVAKRIGITAEFPSPRYFQVHFEYLDSLLLNAAQAIDILRGEVAEVYRLIQEEPISGPDSIDRTSSAATLALQSEPSARTSRSERAIAQRKAKSTAGQ